MVWLVSRRCWLASATARFTAARSDKSDPGFKFAANVLQSVEKWEFEDLFVVGKERGLGVVECDDAVSDFLESLLFAFIFLSSMKIFVSFKPHLPEHSPDMM